MIEEMTLATIAKNISQQSAMAAKKEERARDAALAIREYETAKLALLANTARLRALRLAKEAEQAAPEKKRAKKLAVPPEA
jgi:hypothetical protein